MGLLEFILIEDKRCLFLKVLFGICFVIIFFNFIMLVMGIYIEFVV